MAGGSFIGGLLTGTATSINAKNDRKMRERELSVMETLASRPAAGAPAAPVAPGIANRPQAMAPAGSDGFPSSLVQTESGGNWRALNRQGYGGRLQFGDARLADAAKAGLVPAGTTGAAFSQMAPAQQQAVERWHFADIDSQTRARGLDRYIGQQVGGVTITQDGIRAMAHLGGIGGAARYLSSGGRYNPADSNGTTLRAYAARHGGSATPAPQTAAAPAPQAQPPEPAGTWGWFSNRAKSGGA